MKRTELLFSGQWSASVNQAGHRSISKIRNAIRHPMLMGQFSEQKLHQIMRNVQPKIRFLSIVIYSESKWVFF